MPHFYGAVALLFVEGLCSDGGVEGVLGNIHRPFCRIAKGLSDATAQVQLDGGRLVIYGIGAERPITDTVTVTFKALKSGITEVKLVQVEMDKDANATLETLPLMQIGNNAAVIDVQKAEIKQDAAPAPAEDNSSVLWIVLGAAAVILIAGGITAVLLIRKKKNP